MKSFKTISIAIALFFIIFLVGCQSKQVRHLASDVCLLSPGVTQQEVLTYLGVPNERRLNEQGNEIWLYFQVNKSFLRKTPFIGGKLGDEDYDMVTITFFNEAVSTCVYRAYTEEQMKEMGIMTPDGQ